MAAKGVILVSSARYDKDGLSGNGTSFYRVLTGNDTSSWWIAPLEVSLLEYIWNSFTGNGGSSKRLFVAIKSVNRFKGGFLNLARVM